MNTAGDPAGATLINDAPTRHAGRMGFTQSTLDTWNGTWTHEPYVLDESTSDDPRFDDTCRRRPPTQTRHLSLTGNYHSPPTVSTDSRWLPVVHSHAHIRLDDRHDGRETSGWQEPRQHEGSRGENESVRGLSCAVQCAMICCAMLCCAVLFTDHQRCCQRIRISIGRIDGERVRCIPYITERCR